MRPHRLPAALAFATLLAAVPAAAADLPSEAQVRAVLPTWCKYKNDERVKLEREADKLFGMHPAVPPGKSPSKEMLVEHFQAREKWKEPHLEALNASFKKTTGLDYYAATQVAALAGMSKECKR